uniref:Protein PLASTID REDOX INSENSITIVE 2, chloroplastic-like n=1 Tax=Kalanchoe fedtschenkoi TaxID=63787 RepID=A0A7N1A707_KALFE
MALRCSQILLSMSPVAAATSLASGSITPRFIRSTSLYRPSSTTSNHRSFPISNLSPGVAGAATSEKYVYPDPNPEFTEAEVVKFRGEILKRLANEKEEYGDSLNEVVNVCVQVLREFLLKEYGGPGTFVVEPFTFIMVSLKEKNLPGAPLAARTSLLWAQKHLDEDWEAWISMQKK